MFNPDPSKETIEICFYHKQNNENYPLGLILDSKLDFSEYIEIYFIRHNKKKNQSLLKYLFLIVPVFLKNLKSHSIVIFYVLNNTFFYTQLNFFFVPQKILITFFFFSFSCSVKFWYLSLTFFHRLYFSSSERFWHTSSASFQSFPLCFW